MRHREDGRHLPFASYLVCYLAKTKGLDAVVRGGNGADDGGIFIECGGFGHYWCELNFEEVQYYIDITSEQFGSSIHSETRQRYNRMASIYSS